MTKDAPSQVGPFVASNVAAGAGGCGPGECGADEGDDGARDLVRAQVRPAVGAAGEPGVGHVADHADDPVGPHGRQQVDLTTGAASVADFSGTQPTAEALGRTAVVKLTRGLPLLETTPLYLRESDAKVPGPRKRAL